jgi:hypothetical protein
LNIVKNRFATFEDKIFLTKALEVNRLWLIRRKKMRPRPRNNAYLGSSLLSMFLAVWHASDGRDVLKYNFILVAILDLDHKEIGMLTEVTTLMV